MYWKNVNTRSSYCVSVVVYKIWWAYVGTLSDLAKLLWHTLLKGCRLLRYSVQVGLLPNAWRN
jgi:hypothetical protein